MIDKEETVVTTNLCECGCGGEVNPYRRYIAGHQNRQRTHTKESRLNMSKAHEDVNLSPEHKEAIREGCLREKSPLPSGYDVKMDRKTPINKKCSTYLGCDIAETVASKIFKDAKAMPYGNHGFDIVCNEDKKIDVKSSIFRISGSWVFNIRCNTLADYFLCIGFDNRNDLNPIHIWLIPSGGVNHLTKIAIRKNTVKNWMQYELPIDIISAECEEMKK